MNAICWDVFDEAVSACALLSISIIFGDSGLPFSMKPDADSISIILPFD